MPRETQAIVAHEGRKTWQLETLTLGDPADDELLVEMIACGVCHTDIITGNGEFVAKPTIVLGHEGVGRVREIGKKVTNVAVGDAVVLSIAHCRKCRSCMAGAPPYCEKLLDLNLSGLREDGSTSYSFGENSKDSVKQVKGHFFGQSSMSRLAIVQANCAIKVDHLVPEQDLKKLVLGCGFQTGAGSIINAIKPPVGSSIVVWGCGGVGLAAIMAAKLTNPLHLIAIDTQASKLEFPQRFATHVVDASKEDAVEAIMRITGGRGVDYALDCVGHASILKTAQEVTAVRGTYVTIGCAPGLAPATFFATHQLQRGLTWRGTHQGDSVPQLFVPKMIELWKQGQFPFDELLSFYKFEDFQTALDDMKAGKITKPVLVF